MIHRLPIRGLAPLALTLMAPAAFAQVPMTFGNLAVLRVGDGAAAPTNAATAAFLEEWDPNGAFTTPVQPVIAIPTTASGAQFACTNSGTATTEGLLNLSANNLVLTWGGYDAAVGTPAVASTMVPGTARVIGRFDLLTGLFDTSTAITDGFPMHNIRGVATDDGTRFWAVGSGEGVRYLPNPGATTSTALNSGNLRHVAIFHDELYVTRASGTSFGISVADGGGLPVSPGNITPLAGFPTTSGPSSLDMFWADPDTVYVADDRTNGAGGLQKWTRSAGTWSLAYTLSPSASHGCRAVTGYVQHGVTTLWAIANSGSQTHIVTAVDAGPGSSMTTLRTAPANTNYRGIRYLATVSSLQRQPMACGPADLVCTGNGELGTKVFARMRNATGFAQMIAFDGTFTGIPLGLVFANCNCTLAVTPSPVLLIAGGTFTMDMQPTWATLGLPIAAQGLDLFTPPGGPCPDLFDMTLTDAWTWVVH